MTRAEEILAEMRKLQPIIMAGKIAADDAEKLNEELRLAIEREEEGEDE